MTFSKVCISCRGWTSLANTAVQIKWHQTLLNKERVEDLRQITRGCWIRFLNPTFKSQQVSFGIVISFSTFQTHIKVLQLCFRLQDRFYTHHWFCHFFKKPFYGSKCLPLYVCTEQKLLFYSFSLLDVIYNEILQVWYFMVSTTVCFLYLQTL